jgi:hypothetical protein
MFVVPGTLPQKHSFRNITGLWDLFQTTNGGVPGGSITATIQHTNTQVTYTQIHISHKITPLKQTNKAEESQSAHKATQTLKDYYSQWVQCRKSRRNKAIPDTGLGGRLSCDTSTLWHCLDDRFIVGGEVARRPRLPRIILQNVFWYSLSKPRDMAWLDGSRESNPLPSSGL